jgi:hypothetical protein
MKDLKHVKRFNEATENLNMSDVRSSKLWESLDEKSKSDLINLKNELQFVSEFDIEIYEAIKVIDELHRMNLEQIEELRTHLITNYTTTQLENFTLRLIDRYCSNVE